MRIETRFQLTVPRRCVWCGLLSLSLSTYKCISMTFCTLFSIASRQYVGKELISLNFACLVPLYLRPLLLSYHLVVGWFGFNGPWRQYFSLYTGRLSERESENIENRKNAQTTHIRTYCKRNRPLPYYFPN